VRTDPHPPNPFRVDGTVSNMPEFAEAFKCSKKAKVRILFCCYSFETDVDVVLAQSSEGATVHILVKSWCVEGPALFLPGSLYFIIAAIEISHYFLAKIACAKNACFMCAIPFSLPCFA